MAIENIIFTENLTGKVLNAYNNNVVKFTTNDPDPISANIDIYVGTKNYTFTITPSPSKEFYFNLKQIVSKLINKALFNDENCIYIPEGEIREDINAYLKITVEYTISFDGYDSPTVSFDYEFVKGVNQITEKKFFNERGYSFPLHKPEGNIFYLTFFKGYPFDITLFGENISISIDSFLTEPEFLAADLAAINPSTLYEKSFTNAKGVYRLAISDGQTKWSKIFDKYHSITFGNYLIKLRVIDNKCGIYLKWHNAYGGWDYWLFEKNYISTTKDKLTGSIFNDFENLQNTISQKTAIGKSVQNEMQLFANGVCSDEVSRVLGILDSPKVFMYIGKNGEANDPNNWIEVNVSGKSVSVKSKNNRHILSINLLIPKTYTLQL